MLRPTITPIRPESLIYRLGVVRDPYYPDGWNVSSNDPADTRVARFSGPGAHDRAIEYAKWKNGEKVIVQKVLKGGVE